MHHADPKNSKNGLMRVINGVPFMPPQRTSQPTNLEPEETRNADKKGIGEGQHYSSLYKNYSVQDNVGRLIYYKRGISSHYNSLPTSKSDAIPNRGSITFRDTKKG